MKISDRLRRAAELQEEKEKEYGKGYKKSPLSAFFPDGITLETDSEFRRMAVFVLLCTKMNRYAQNFKEGGHLDSCRDLTVYGAMLEELTEEQLKEKLNEISD